MAYQPHDEHYEFGNTAEYNRVETSQYSANINRNLPEPVTFSSILLPSKAWSSTPIVLPSTFEDSDDLTKILNITPELEQEMNDFFERNSFESLMPSTNYFDEYFLETPDLIDLKKLDRSIADREMSVEIQPPANIRRRYESDGKRQIEKSRSKPMTIKLPILKGHISNPDQSFWLELILTTTDQNPAGKAYIHVDRLEYHAEDIETHDGGFVRVPLIATDIQKGTKQLARISITKSKLDTYTCKLMPLNISSIDETTETFEHVNNKSVVARAKRFRDAYNLNSSQISFQLLIKQKQTWHKTDIKCESIIMEEKAQSKTTKEGKKRSTPSDTTDDDDEEPPIHRQTSSKNRKLSSPPIETLPVIRAGKT